MLSDNSRCSETLTKVQRELEFMLGEKFVVISHEMNLEQVNRKY